MRGNELFADYRVTTLIRERTRSLFWRVRGIEVRKLKFESPSKLRRLQLPVYTRAPKKGQAEDIKEDKRYDIFRCL